MKIKTLVAVLLLAGGATGAYAQNDCKANSSISHEAAKAKNWERCLCSLYGSVEGLSYTEILYLYGCRRYSGWFDEAYQGS